MAKYKLNVTITEETAEILKEMADEYGSTMGAMVVLLAKDWKKTKQAMQISDLCKSIQLMAGDDE